MVEKYQEAAQVAVDAASVAWRRFWCGPVGSTGIVRWVGAWVADAFVVLLAVATTLREHPHEVTLWWLLLLAWLIGNVASVAREQKRHDPRAWVYVGIVFLISGMTVPLAWYSVGLTLLIAAAIQSWPVEWAVVFVQRVGGLATTVLAWVGALGLLTTLG